MGGILVLAEQVRGQVPDATFASLAAATALRGVVGSPVAVLVVGPSLDLEAVVPMLDVPGVGEILAIETPEDFNPDVVAHAAEAAIRERGPALVLAGFTVNGTSVGARLAVDLDLGFASNVIDVAVADGRVTAVREIHSGKVRADLEFEAGKSVVLLVRSSSAVLPEGRGGATVAHGTAHIDPALVRSHHLAYQEAPRDEEDLTRATFIVSIGRGIGDKDNVSLFRGLASKAGALLGSSRPAVDAGWMPRSRQVGQSGAIVKPDVYLAFGISGANEHLAGMRGSGTIIAVNTDPRAPIFNVAHYGAVADAVEVAEELERLLG
jgi:electron transfer flavoprotein alpha subunit